MSKYLPEDEDMIKTLDAKNEDAKKKNVARNSYVLEMSHLTIALRIQALLKKVNTVCTDKGPGGLAYEIIELLIEKQQPKNLISMVEMKLNISAINLTKYDKPESYSGNLSQQIISLVL